MATPPFYLTNAHPSAPHSRGQTQDWHWRVTAWVMAISSGDALESRSDEEPSESLPWNIIALMRPVQQQGLWPRFSLFFKNLDGFPLWCFWCYARVPSCCFIYDTIYLLLCGEAAYGCSWQRHASPPSYSWVIFLISLPAIENLRWMLVIWSFRGDDFQLNSSMHCCVSVSRMMSSLDRCVECFITFLGLVILT